MNARTRELIDAANKALEKAGLEQSEAGAGLTLVIATMLDAAIPKKPVIRADVEAKLPFSPAQLFNALEAGCPDRLTLRPYEQGSFGRLGKALGRIQGLEAADLDRLVGWINSGALAFWDRKPTWTHVVKHITNWIAQARAWEANGGHGGNELGAEAWR